MSVASSRNRKTSLRLAEKNWNDLSPFYERLEKSVGTNDRDAIKVNELGKAYALAMNIRRDGEVLRQLGESAGVDFSFAENRFLF